MNKFTSEDREIFFLSQSDAFIQKMLELYGIEHLSALEPMTSRRPFPIEPVIVEDYRSITSDQCSRLSNDYFSEQGVAYFIILNPSVLSSHRHPLLEIAYQLIDDLNLHYPLSHPLEQHPNTISRFGPPDGTLKIHSVEKNKGYREQGETAEMFAMHHDGLGSGGTVKTAALYMESPPLFGGYTFFQNISRLALELARDDLEAFRQLFLPDAITMVRPRGKGAIKVRGPVLYLNEEGSPQSFFRISSGEYQVSWRQNSPALNRAMKFLNQYSKPFSFGSSFIHFTAPGHGCFIRNQTVAHGRTPFIEGNEPYQKRLLARKWYMASVRDAEYKHVPGIFISKQYAELYPELFGPDVLEGEWLYDISSDSNKRIK